MDNSALVKYYDPRTGKYEFATVLDVGDLSKLNTTIKTDLVSAINSLEGSGWGGGGEVPPALIDELKNIKDAIASIKDGTFIIEEWGSFDQYFQSGIADAIEQLNIFNREQIVITVEEIEAAIQESKDYYDQHLAETMQDVESARTDMSNAQQTLNETAQRLEEADLNYSEVTLKVDEIDQYIEGNIKSVKFDVVNAVVTEYESLVRQMEDEFGVNVGESFLSYLTGRVGQAEADISVQSGKIESKVGYDEFQYMPVEDIDQYNKNLLFHTMDFSENWERNDVRAYVSTDSFRHTRIIAMDISNAYYSSITDDLELGKTYTLSASFNIQPITKAPNEDRFAPTDGNYGVSAFIDGTEYPMVDLVENLTGINGFKRLSVSFVSENENPEVYFRIKNLNAETSTGYMTAPKLEAGNKSTPWQPHFDDEYATMLSTNSLVRQQGNEIVSLISSNKELGDKFVTATSSFQQLEDGFIRNAELIEEYEDAVVRYGMEVEELNDRITQKVWMDDFSDAVETISIDGKNRVLNSDFVDMSTDNNQLVLGSWENVDPLFTIEKIDGVNYAVIKRTGLTGNIVASMASNRFAVKNGERLMFGFDIIVEAMPDVGSVFQIELLDINDIRVGLESFTLDQMDGDITLGEVSRLNYQYIINREDVAKARVRLMLTRNGHVKFTRVMAQQGTIKDTEWNPAPEDAQILRMKMQTEINQTAQTVEILASDERMDALEGILYKKDGKFQVSPTEILARVTSAELGEDAVVTGTQLKLTEEGLRLDLVDKEGIIQTINASEDGLKIDFDRVEVNGLLLAQIISTQYLDVSEGFKIMHGSNMILGIHPQTGELTMNVPKLTINAKPVATQEDLEKIELTPGPKGEDGVAGKDGVGVTDTNINYAVSDSGTERPTTWGNEVPVANPGMYVWTRTEWSYNDGTKEFGYSVSRIGKDGNTGKDGVAGKDGVGIKSTVIHYGGSTSGTSHSGVTWTTAIPSVPNGQFLWTRTTWTYDDNTTETGYSVAKMGETGAKGATGPQGVSITKVDVQYYLSTSNTSLTGGSWSTTAPAWIDGRFMWSKTVTTYTSGSPTESKPVCITGAKGTTGSTGSTGATGRGVSSIVEQFYLSTSKTTQTGGSWVETPPAWSNGKYIWTRSLITYTTGTPATSTTKPLVSSEWEAVNELEIGGTNLIKGSATPRIMLPRNSGTDTDNFNFIQMQAPMKSGETYTLSFDAKITHGSFGALDIYTQYGHTSTTRHSIVGGRVVATFIAAATTDAAITYIYAGISSGTRGNGLIISNYKLEKGNKATDWSPAPEDLYQYVDDVEIGGTNLLKNSRTIYLSSNNTSLYPTSITQTEEEGRVFSRLRRTNLTLSPSVFSIFSTINIGDINQSIFENEYTVVSFKARASQNVTMNTMGTTFGGSPLVTGTLGDINITTEWKTFYSIFPKIPKSASGFRVNPLSPITSVNMSTFYLDVCEYKIEKGNKVTGWSPAPEEVQSSIDLKADGTSTEAALNEAAAKLQVLQQEVEAAATADELKNFVAQYNKEQEALSADKATSEKNLSDAMISIDAITNNMGDMSETWKFVDRSIRNTPQGIVIGNESSGSFIRINEQEIGFFSNGQRVAFVAQNVMQIDKGIFVEEIQVAKYKFEESTTNHLTIRYAG